MTYIDTQRNALGGGTRYAVKIRNADDTATGETKWITASPDQADRILRILAEGEKPHELLPDVPDDHPVKVLTPEQAKQATDPMTCGTCQRTWDDAISTSMTPVPAARCPFEYYH